MVFSLRICLLSVLLLTAASRASADPSSSERETARSLMLDGDRLRDAGDRAGALERYRAAHAIMHVPTTGVALAEAHAQLGQLVEARSVAIDVVNLAVRESEPSAFAAARSKAAELARALEPRVATLTTTVQPAGAAYSLQVDDVALPQAARAAPFKTNPGAHRVRVEAPGYEPAERRVQLAEGQTASVSFTLTRAPEPDRRVADAPPPSAASAPAPMPPDDRDPASAGRVRGIIGLSAGGLVLAAGIATGVMSWVSAHDEKARCAPDGGCDASRAAALSRANTLANVANIAIPIGVVGIAYGLYELLSLPDAPAAKLQLAVSPLGVEIKGKL